MAAPLEELRCKVTRETMVVLRAHATVRRVDITQIVREVLDFWAHEQMDIARQIMMEIDFISPYEQEQPQVRIAKTIAFMSDEESKFRRRPMTSELRRAVFSRDGGKCKYCGMNVGLMREHFGLSWHIDHILPVSQGGTNDEGNLTLACSMCNLEKGAKTPEQWQGT